MKKSHRSPRRAGGIHPLEGPDAWLGGRDRPPGSVQRRRGSHGQYEYRCLGLHEASLHHGDHRPGSFPNTERGGGTPHPDLASFWSEPPPLRSLVPEDNVVIAVFSQRDGRDGDRRPRRRSPRPPCPARRVPATSVCTNGHIHCFKVPRAMGLPADPVLQRGSRNSERMSGVLVIITKLASRATGLEPGPPSVPAGAVRHSAPSLLTCCPPKPGRPPGRRRRREPPRV